MMPVLESHIQLVNDAIQSLGIDPDKCQQKEHRNTWKLHRGDVQMILIVQESLSHNESKTATMAAMCPLLKIDDNLSSNIDFLKFVLELNHKLISESFSLSNDWLILSAAYYIDNMRRPEIVTMIESLSYHAEKLNEIIANKFELNN